MDLGPCPGCGSRDVRAGRSIVTHLIHLARGTHRRYCLRCRRRWLSGEAAFSHSARDLCFLLCAAPWLLLLAWVAAEIITAPRVRRAHPAARGYAIRRDARPGAAGWSAPYAGYPGNAGGPFSGPPALYGSGYREAFYTGGGSWRTGQVLNADHLYRQVLQAGGGISGAEAQLMLLLRQGRIPPALVREIETSDKQTLWNKYGSHFSSKDEAKAAYEKFMRERNSSR